jgi:hypothetical protein
VSERNALEEYKVNIDLWKHEDTLRQQRNSTFLAVNAALLVASGVVLGTRMDSAVRAGAVVLASVVGLLLCESWLTVQARHDAYIRFRRHQLRDLEGPLSFTSFMRAYDVFHRASR